MSDFDQKAATWEQNPIHRARTEAIAAAMRRRIPMDPAWKAIEVGCGTGLLSFALCDELGSVLLVDTSEGMLEVLRGKIEAAGIATMRPTLLDLTQGPLPAERFDLVFLQMALHHIADIDGILGRFHRLLAAGGWLAIADLDREDGSFHGAGFDGHNGFDRADLLARAASAGFHDGAIETVFEIRRPMDAGERAYPVFLLVARRG